MLYLKEEESSKSRMESFRISLSKLVNTITESKIPASNKLTAISKSKFCIECVLNNLKSNFS